MHLRDGHIHRITLPAAHLESSSREGIIFRGEAGTPGLTGTPETPGQAKGLKAQGGFVEQVPVRGIILFS